MARARRASLKKMVDRFALLHPINVALSTGFGLFQLVVFARVLDVGRYAEIIFITTLGMFLLPLNVAAGRANYIALREGIVRNRDASNWPQVTFLLALQFILITLLSIVLPLFLPDQAVGKAMENMIYLNTCLMTNYLLNDVQVTAWAVELDTRFVYVLVGRSLAQYLALAMLWATHSFIDFVLVSLFINFLSLGLLLLFFRRHALLKIRQAQGALSMDLVLVHGKRLVSSLLSSVSEMTVLTLPYALLTVVFGIGPALITYDVIMKFLRVVTAIGRMLSEVALPSITRRLHTDRPSEAWRIYLVVLGLCFGGALVLAVAVLLFDRPLFRLLLGPSDVVPDGAGVAAAVIILTGALFQPALYVVSVDNKRELILRFTGIALVGFGCFAAVAFFRLPLLETIWAYSAYFAVVTAALLLLSHRAMFKHAAAR